MIQPPTAAPSRRLSVSEKLLVAMLLGDKVQRHASPVPGTHPPKFVQLTVKGHATEEKKVTESMLLTLVRQGFVTADARPALLQKVLNYQLTREGKAEAKRLQPLEKASKHE
jgi:hypothetical protein